MLGPTRPESWLHHRPFRSPSLMRIGTGGGRIQVHDRFPVNPQESVARSTQGSRSTRWWSAVRTRRTKMADPSHLSRKVA